MRVLRALVASGGQPLNTGELARRSALARTSVYHALKTLENAGLAAPIGAGRQRPVAFVASHPLAPAIRQLFEAEAKAFTDFLSALRAATTAVPDAIAVWIEGSAAKGTDRLGDPITCYLLADAARLEPLTTTFRRAIASIAERHDVTITVHGVTRHELALRDDDHARALLDVILLGGTPPAAFHPGARQWLTEGRRGVRRHRDHDQTALETARALAALIAEDPGSVTRILEHIERRLARASSGERHELMEWAQLFRTSSPRLLRSLLLDPGERMTRLRQTMPFLHVLDETTRARLGVARARAGED